MLMYEVSVYPFSSLNHVKFHCSHIFSVVADTSIYVPYYNKWSLKILVATNNRTVPLITDGFQLI